MKLGIVYWSSGGNTEELASKAKEVALEKGVEVVYSNIDSMNRDEFFSSDAFAFGSPAQGEEELATEIQDLMDSISSEIENKKIILFGSFGWGDGEYMEEWKSIINNKGGILSFEPVVCLESPDDEAFNKISEAINSLI